MIKQNKSKSQKSKKELIKNLDSEIIFTHFTKKGLKVTKFVTEDDLRRIIEIKNHFNKQERINSNKFRNITTHGKSYDLDNLADYVEVIRKYYGQRQRKQKSKSFTSWKSVVIHKYGNDKKYNAFMKFINKISKDKNPIFIEEYFEQGKNNRQIASILKEKYLLD